MTLHVDPFVFWWAVLVTCALLGVPLNRYRRDIAALRHADEVIARLTRERDDALTEVAETRAQWCADSDEWAIREVEHRAVCLGERVIPLERCS